MSDEYRDHWRLVRGEPLKAYGDGYADGRRFEGPISHRQGFEAGWRWAFAIIGMANAIRNFPSIQACVDCHKATYQWIGTKGQCGKCWDLEHPAAARAWAAHTKGVAR